MPTAAPILVCPRCGSPLPNETHPGREDTSCPSCDVATVIELFPARFAVRAVARPELAGAEEATCFYHADKRAAAPCDSCGRFLCELCRVEWAGQNLCPACIHAGQAKRAPEQVTSRTLYDSIALTLATLPLLIFYFTLITAPITLFLVIRYWKAPTSLVPRTRIRMYLAALFALVELGGWIALVCFLLYRAGVLR